MAMPQMQSNPIVNNANPFAQLQSMMNMAKSFNNTDAFLDSITPMNPKAAEVKTLINQYHGDAKAAFYAKAKEAGVDPNSILSMIPH